jgi:hypothetical protein
MLGNGLSTSDENPVGVDRSHIVDPFECFFEINIATDGEDRSADTHRPTPTG